MCPRYLSSTRRVCPRCGAPLSAAVRRRDWLAWIPLLAGAIAFGIGLGIAAVVKRGDEPTAVVHTQVIEAPGRSAELWCICYETTRGGYRRRSTACRGTAGACESLRTKAQDGRNGFVAGAASASCTRIEAVVPWQRLGTRDQWGPSANPEPGSFVSDGRCLLD